MQKTIFLILILILTLTLIMIMMLSMLMIMYMKLLQQFQKKYKLSLYICYIIIIFLCFVYMLCIIYCFIGYQFKLFFSFFSYPKFAERKFNLMESKFKELKNRNLKRFKKEIYSCFVWRSWDKLELNFLSQLQYSCKI